MINQIVLCFVFHFFSCSKRSISIFVFKTFWFFFKRSIYSVAVILILFVSISVFRTKMILFLIIISIELLFLSIYLILMISRRLYDWRKFITSIINRFFSKIFNFIKHWYNDLKSVQTINKMLNRNIFLPLFLKSLQSQIYKSIHIIQKLERFKSFVCIWLKINVKCWLDSMHQLNKLHNQFEK